MLGVEFVLLFIVVFGLVMLKFIGSFVDGMIFWMIGLKMVCEYIVFYFE